MRGSWTKKDEQQYQRALRRCQKGSVGRSGRSKARCERIAAATVHKSRAARSGGCLCPRGYEKVKSATDGSRSVCKKRGGSARIACRRSGGAKRRAAAPRSAPIRVRRIRLDRQGHDESGRYWGVGAPLYAYEYEVDGGRRAGHLRAPNLRAARKLVRSELGSSRLPAPAQRLPPGDAPARRQLEFQPADQGEALPALGGEQSYADLAGRRRPPIRSRCYACGRLIPVNEEHRCPAGFELKFNVEALQRKVDDLNEALDRCRRGKEER